MKLASLRTRNHRVTASQDRQSDNYHNRDEETGTLEPPSKKHHLLPQASRQLQTSGHKSVPKSKVQAGKQLSTSYQHADVAAIQKQHRHEKPNSDWSVDSASETEYTPKGFESHPSNLYYIDDNKDNDDPAISLYANVVSFDDDSDPAFVF